MADVWIRNGGSLMLFVGESDAGESWLEEHIGHATRYAGTYVVEPRYAVDVAAGIVGDGLVVV
jgi:hypothetical protein